MTREEAIAKIERIAVKLHGTGYVGGTGTFLVNALAEDLHAAFGSVPSYTTHALTEECARYRAALEMITQLLSGNVRVANKIATAALAGKDMRKLEDVEAI